MARTPSPAVSRGVSARRLPWLLLLLLGVALTSVPAGPAATPVPAGPAVARSSVVFVDGFESGTLESWTTSAGAEVRGDRVAHDAYAARLRGDDTPAYVMKGLKAPVADAEISADLTVVSQRSGVTLLQVKTSSGKPIASVRLNRGGSLDSLNHITGTTATSSSTLGDGGWHRLGLRIRVGAAGALHVVLDGAIVPQLSQEGNLGSAPVGRLQVGDRSGTRAELTADDVTLTDAQTAPDRTAPSSPTGVSAEPVTPTRVDLTWRAAADNRGVVRYELIRDGAVLGVSTGVSFSDVWAPPGAAAAYAIVAVDADGNRSAPSAASATTPPAPAPGTRLAADGFDRPDGPLGTAETGQPWTTDTVSVWAVESELARIIEGRDPGKTATAVDVGVSDRIKIEADITLSPTRNRANVGLSYHYGTPTMHMWAKLEVSPGHPGGLITIGRQDPTGTMSLLASARGVGLVNGETYHAGVELDGPNVRFTVSGGELTAPVTVTYSLTRAEQLVYMTTTAAGLRIRTVSDEDDGRSRWDNFTVTAI
jgi:hypothetical protein